MSEIYILQNHRNNNQKALMLEAIISSYETALRRIYPSPLTNPTKNLLEFFHAGRLTYEGV